MAQMPHKFLFVCMGNICRSPTAHGVMQARVNALDLHNQVYIDSAGTHAYHVGEGSDRRSIAFAASRGVDLSFVRARHLAAEDYYAFDAIFAMDERNLELIEARAPQDATAEITLFLSAARRDALTEARVVPDPYYGGEQGFAEVFDLVEIGCDAILSRYGLVMPVA